MAADAPRLAVVIPAHNEADNLEACLDSVYGQGLSVRALVSDNASVDSTPQMLDSMDRPRDRFTTRRTGLLRPSEHFVSSGRWALGTGAEEFLAFLAADDRWSTGFARACVAALDRNPGADMAFPRFVWRGEGLEDRTIQPPRLDQRSGAARQLRALVLPDRVELANQLYGVFRRSAFEEMLDAWDRGGEGLGVDYASVLAVLGGHRSVPVPDAESVRSIRAGQDLIERAGVTRPVGSGLVRLGTTYVRLNLRINSEIGHAMGRVTDRSPLVPVTVTQLARMPQWLASIPRQVSAGRS